MARNIICRSQVLHPTPILLRPEREAFHALRVGAMHVCILQLVFCGFRLEVFGRHPYVGWERASKVLHIEVATHGDEARISR